MKYLPFLLFLAMVVKRNRHKSFLYAFVNGNFLRTPYHILCILMVAKQWWNYTPFLYSEVNGNFLQRLCCIFNMCILSLLVMRRNRCAKIGERL